MEILIGILIGMGFPLQTVVNARLRLRTGSAPSATLVSFCVSLGLLLFAFLFAPAVRPGLLDDLLAGPWWLFSGGLWGVIFLTGNILLLSRLGSVQTVIFPVLGQVFGGLVIDHFGLLEAVRSPLTLLKASGALLVLAGVVAVTLEKARENRTNGSSASSIASFSTLLWRLFGISMGAMGAVQVAANGALGRLAGSSLFAAIVSFGGGVLLLGLLVGSTALAGRGRDETRTAVPWWCWIAGGAFGAVSVVANVMLSGMIGTGATVMVFLIGSSLGGVWIDHFGTLGVNRSPVTTMKLLGIAAMLAGAAMIRLPG